jgi:hypothetical protein
MRSAVTAAVVASLSASPLLAADPPRVRELRTQQGGDTTYFHVRFDNPTDMGLPRLDAARLATEAWRRDLARLPQLVPQDEKTHAVYHRWAIPEPILERRFPIRRGDPIPPPPPPVEGLEFVGKVRGQGAAQFLLLYPLQEEVAAPVKPGNQAEPAPAGIVRRRAGAEVAVTLDLSTAQRVAAPVGGGKRKPTEPVSRDDLPGLWALGQATRFAVLEAMTPDFGYYPFAREATARKYGVPAPSIASGWLASSREWLDRQMYETTTGAAAIAESLQLHRMLNASLRDTKDRSVPIARVQGIDIAEHPWEKMMAGKQPAPEPLAKLVPHDNYYLHFKNVRKFIELGELLDQWGTNLVRAYELTSRDYQLKQRYERQICLKSTWMGKTLGPAVIRGLAVTGSDGYLREGSDVTVIFQVTNRPLFLAAVEPFIDEARKEFAGQLREAKEPYHEITIESYATPLREVSLHRAMFGDYVVYSNSPVGVRRVIDTHQGRHKALADSLDFQYMRTVFRLDEPEEDGFAFLSDPFIRQLVGPASKIKEKRRLEALTSMYMVTHGALFTAWETAKLPNDQKLLMEVSGLKPEEVYAPEGNGVTWDRTRQTAVSDVYNTLRFTTPLIELPIDLITPQEEQDYLRFRAEYMGLWRQFFDPIGMRFALKDERVQVDTYILPLVRTSRYNELRQRTGGGTTTFDTATISPKTLVQFVSHISTEAPERNHLAQAMNLLGGRVRGLDWLGDWFMIRLDDSPIYGRIAQRWLRREMEPQDQVNWDEELRESARLFFQVPLTVGVGIKNTLVFAGVLAAVKSTLNDVLPGAITWEPMEPAYKGVSIVRIQATETGVIGQELNRNRKPEQPAITPAIYYALIDGTWYASLSEEPLKELIDRSVARREGKEPEKKGEKVQVNNSLYLAPEAAAKAGDFIRTYLEWETHKRALANNPILYALFHSGLVAENATADAVNGAALRYFGYLPVSPDGAGYAFESRTDEVVNRRHGSLRRPQLHTALATDAPLGRLLEQLRTLRADLRFREDGIHTVLTIERKP